VSDKDFFIPVRANSKDLVKQSVFPKRPMSFIFWQEFNRLKMWALVCWILSPLSFLAALSLVAIPELWISIELNIPISVILFSFPMLLEFLRRKCLKKATEFEEIAKYCLKQELGYTDKGEQK